MIPKTLAVIHHKNMDLSRHNAEIASSAGFDGFVLIQMQGRDWQLDEPLVRIKTDYPNMLMIANRLSASPIEAVHQDKLLDLDGTWSDYPVLDKNEFSCSVTEIDYQLEKARWLNPDFLFFASVALKGHPFVSNPIPAAKLAATKPWIVTTSGSATGQPPSEEKIQYMSEAVGGPAKLAVASGMTPDNIGLYAPYVGWVFVSTGITIDPSTDLFDYDLARRFVVNCKKHGDKT